jgi:Flp pilus assembly protein TadB
MINPPGVSVEDSLRMQQAQQKENVGRKVTTSRTRALGIRCLLFAYRALFLIGVALGIVYAIAPVLYQRSLNGMFYAILLMVLLLRYAWWKGRR